jgi:hypothetical protein
MFVASLFDKFDGFSVLKQRSVKQTKSSNCEAIKREASN